ncbi:hypothetical protein PF007_g31141 [Phytophthora fragariae]|uniref:Uncharacterized protein n=1 Tax=Phytophthora fragariae TaxID=53985 RepID=A0A6A3PMB7_9STRA|nr:hypothetical protein PF009_g32629 [Phytophthora fragariae]KAE9055658.1 hypothetical protein PF006_g32895 [Phytophthora fragariae]KAE9058875.1 hypothetical protein PF007_g31141 [Phytophthora fragariae]KAE9259276.1 hypothetical protein PF008_g33406 [Phytophthora fragariae]KAE9260540.1 hypothetical protein PF001_g32684 [Phytophthora fragariae]
MRMICVCFPSNSSFFSAVESPDLTIEPSTISVSFFSWKTVFIAHL